VRGIAGREAGGFSFVHAATASGWDRTHERCLIVPSSGTDSLVSIRGTSGLGADDSGRHRPGSTTRWRPDVPRDGAGAWPLG
jgi:Protein of unknown function (DUF3224)